MTYAPDRPVSSRRKGFLLWGAVSGGLAVAAGAFGAHALKDSMPPDRLAIFETGAKYQMYHALALLAMSCRPASVQSRRLAAAGVLFIVGICLFSGSLYALAFTGIHGLGIITPFGGVSWLLGWALLVLAAFRGES